ncbi:MAG: tRNA (adenosine(37)-N6)-threonylcarbamoyltransferase complex ATPase subunit type 1 TsaE [Planctomycetota bacterium]
MEERDTITPSEKRHSTYSPEETSAFAERLGADLKGCEIVGLIGDLGAGKTTFVRGLARGMHVDDPGAVKSPSYTLVISYPGPLPLLHLDAYFMQSSEDLDLCGMEDALDCGHVVVIEWADRIQSLLPERVIYVYLETTGLDERLIRVVPALPGAGKPDTGK